MDPFNLETHDLYSWENAFNYLLDDFLSSIFCVLALFNFYYYILDVLYCFLNLLFSLDLFSVFFSSCSQFRDAVSSETLWDIHNRCWKISSSSVAFIILPSCFFPFCSGFYLPSWGLPRLETLNMYMRLVDFKLHCNVIWVARLLENCDVSDFRSFFLGCSDSSKENLPVFYMSDRNLLEYLRTQEFIHMNSPKPVVVSMVSISFIWGPVVSTLITAPSLASSLCCGIHLKSAALKY